jgi:Peptidase inhibitor I78 family
MRPGFLSFAAFGFLLATQAPAKESPNEEVPEYGAGECSAAKLKYLIGKSATRARVNWAFKASKAKTLRTSREWQAVTQDYRTDRLNIITDRRNIIRRINCK